MSDLPTIDSTLLSLIARWVDLLAHQRYREALALLAPSKHWTPELLETVISNYGFVEPCPDGERFVVTPISEATGDGPRAEVTWFDDHRGYVHYDLPLNGEWSDVTAEFDIVAEGDGFTLALDDIHVM